jgi:hypothetical protein
LYHNVLPRASIKLIKRKKKAYPHPSIDAVGGGVKEDKGYI